MKAFFGKFVFEPFEFLDDCVYIPLTRCGVSLYPNDKLLASLEPYYIIPTIGIGLCPLEVCVYIYAAHCTGSATYSYLLSVLTLYCFLALQGNKTSRYCRRSEIHSGAAPKLLRETISATTSADRPEKVFRSPQLLIASSSDSGSKELMSLADNPRSKK